ncbi:MAG: M1 family metallopeptidase [Phycisphaerales bacterium]
MNAQWMCRVRGLAASVLAASASLQSGCHAPSPVSEAPAAGPIPAPAARSLDRRDFAPRKPETIFSPLDLAAPNRIRAADGSPGPDYWQQRADYVINAALDERSHRITGTARVTYQNNSPQELRFIWIHLEQNLFRDNSLATLSSLPDARFTKKAGFDGGINVESVRGPAGEPLPLTVYDTVGRIDLPVPLPPATNPHTGGPTLTFDIAWSFQVPEYGIDRMGIDKTEAGEIFQIAQWFPAVCVFDDVHGWNTLPYLGQGEFYTNFGSFDVKLTVPRSHIVAATGVLQNESEVLTPTQVERLASARASAQTVVIRSADEVGDPASRPGGAADASLTWHFRADHVRTFAWASSAAFVWDAARVNGSVGTLAQSVYPREAAPLWSQSTRMLKSAIEGYNARWFEYPYPVATNVNGRVGGMEYPMIIFCSERHDERGLFGVTTHEIGHNWFPMVVNTDERRHAWMDEGFNSFINIYSEMEYFHESRPGERGRSFAGSLRTENPPMDTPHDLLGPGLSGNLEYAKTAHALYLLREQVLGPERFDTAFREYIRRWAFKSPRPSDFFRTMEGVSGANLAWFWRGWFTESTTLDQAVEAVEQRSDRQTATITLLNLGEMVMPVSMRVEFDRGDAMLVRLPAEIWQWTNRWKADIETGGRRVTRVTLDPDEALPDSNGSNNVWPQ